MLNDASQQHMELVKKIQSIRSKLSSYKARLSDSDAVRIGSQYRIRVPMSSPELQAKSGGSVS